MSAGVKNLSAPVTIAAWVKIAYPRMDCRFISGSANENEPAGTIKFTGCRAQVWNGKDWIEIIPFIATNDTWQHITLVFEDDGKSSGYVNGRKKKTVESGFDIRETELMIGKGFAGEIDEFKIFNKALTAKEIKSLYTPGRFKKAEKQDGTAITKLGKRAIEESAEPVRPGIPGVRPFWNSHSPRFIYAPAFDFKTLPNADVYRFIAACHADGSKVMFEADLPTAALSPIWLDMPAGPISLTVEGLDKSGGSVVGIAGNRDFVKSLPFNGPYSGAAAGYTECAKASLAAQFNSKKFQDVLKNGNPDYNFVFPCKLMGGLIRGMIVYAKLEPEYAEDAMRMAKLTADWMIKLTEKEGTPLADWPPTYWNGWPPDDEKYTLQNHMTHYPAEAALAYLDLYDATKDEKYMTAVRKIADRYMKLRLKQGTWYQILNPISGKPAAPNLLVPTYIIEFFDRLKNQYGISDYAEARDKAFNWIMANTMKTYNWQGQFEDVGAKKPYEDQSNPDVTKMAEIMFASSGEHPEYIELAKDLLRFAEDQFVVWDRRDAIARPNWALPGALEQYVCYTSINASNTAFINAYIAAYKATGDEIYKAKLIALADTLTHAWKGFGETEIPTWMNYGEESNNWVNCSMISALTLIACEKYK